MCIFVTNYTLVSIGCFDPYAGNINGGFCDGYNEASLNVLNG